MDIDELQRMFHDPPNEYRIAPLFRFNDRLDPGKLRWQVRSLKEQGCGGLFLYCERFQDGTPHKFLSGDWWQVVELVAEACADEGLDFWVYDEEDWPSGTAGGQIIEKYPEVNWKYLHPEEHALEGPVDATIETGPEVFVAASAYQKDGTQLIPESIVDLSHTVKNGMLQWTVPKGSWTIAVYTCRAGKGFYTGGYPDLMDRKAGSEFVKAVYEEHWERLRKIERLTFKGYFTDEPCMSYAMISFGEGFDWYPSMPYTPALPEAFEKQHGYEWRENLPLLYYDAGPEALQFRCHYWETCCRLYHENYFGQIYRFCEKHRLLSSGHLVIEEQFIGHLSMQGGDLMTHYRLMHIPGIDWIYPFQNHLPSTAAKYATSIAHLLGKDRTWCEAFAASGWGLTFQEMRDIVNWLHVNGINMLVPICYKYSLSGPNRTTFYNPGISYQQPYWDHFRGFADYVARLCLLASGGGHVAPVALVYPSTDIRAHCWDVDLLARRSEQYNRLGDLIRAAGYDYDILDHHALLEESQIESGYLITSTERFEVLVVPEVDVIRRKVVERCVDLVRSGGTVIFVGNFPTYSYESGRDDAELSSLIHRLCGEDAHRRAAKGEVFWEQSGKGRAGYSPSGEEVPSMLRSVLDPDLALPSEERNLFAYHRRIDQNHLYFLFNRSDDARDLEVVVRAKGRPEIWDPVHGTIRPLREYATEETGTRLRLHFAPRELIPLMVRPSPSETSEQNGLKTFQEIPVPGPFRFRAEDTMKRPEVAWNFTQQEDKWTSIEGPLSVPEEMPAGDWCQHGLATFSGLGHYEAEVSIPNLPADTRVILDLGRVSISAEVLVNGTSAGFVFFEPYQIDITEQITPGKNQLEIIVANTLANYYSQFKELSKKPLNEGGVKPERKVSGLLGPVTVRIVEGL